MDPAPSDANPSDEVPPPERAPGMRAQRRLHRVQAWAVLVALLVLVVLAVAMLIPEHSAPRRPFRCAANLSALAALYSDAADDPAWRPRSGQALLLAWRQEGRIGARQELVLICPGDQQISEPDTPDARARYDSADLDDPPDDLCSYAVRDFERFPIDPAHLANEPLFACVGRLVNGQWTAFHREASGFPGFPVAFADGSVNFLSRADLGLPAGADPIVGPASPSPVLRVLCFRPGRDDR